MALSFNNFCVKWTKHSNISFTDKPINHINVGVFPDEVIKPYGDNRDTYGYVCTNTKYMIEIISIQLRCSINFTVPKDGFGGYKVNGTWNGILALFEQKLADVILQFFTFHNQRDTIADLNPYYPSQKLITILSSPSYKSENVLKIFFTFSLDTWILLLLSFISVSVINGFVYKQYMKRFSISIDYFGALLAQSSILNRNHLKSLAYVWLIATLLIRNFFTSDIQALLLSKKEILIESLQQIIEDTSIIPMIEENSSLHRHIIMEFPRLSRRIVTINHSARYRMSTLINVLKNSYALITSEYICEQIMEYYHKFRWHQSEESKYSALGGFPIRKGVNKTQKEKLIKIFRALYQYGIYEYNRRKDITYFYYLDSITLHKPNSIQHSDTAVSEYHYNSDERTLVVIKLRSLLVCFVLLMFGCIFSLKLLLIEFLIEYLKCKKLRLTQKFSPQYRVSK